MSISKTLSAIACVGLLTFALGGCEKQKGPAERAGEKIDKAVEEAGKTMDKASDKAKEAIESAGEAMEKAGDTAKEATKQ